MSNCEGCRRFGSWLKGYLREATRIEAKLIRASRSPGKARDPQTRELATHTSLVVFGATDALRVVAEQWDQRFPAAKKRKVPR